MELANEVPHMAREPSHFRLSQGVGFVILTASLEHAQGTAELELTTGQSRAAGPIRLNSTFPVPGLETAPLVLNRDVPILEPLAPDSFTKATNINKGNHHGNLNSKEWNKSGSVTEPSQFEKPLLVKAAMLEAERMAVDFVINQDGRCSSANS